eukprot:GHVS01053218.1.p1 GENE.GHVS01053218.1~~GHVS01053218.1.p1  ORF type:complete len:662 (+),score=90.02 GHVS01053218.1:174-2159(+)
MTISPSSPGGSRPPSLPLASSPSLPRQLPLPLRYDLHASDGWSTSSLGPVAQNPSRYCRSTLPGSQALLPRFSVSPVHSAMPSSGPSHAVEQSSESSHGESDQIASPDEGRWTDRGMATDFRVSSVPSDVSSFRNLNKGGDSIEGGEDERMNGGRSVSLRRSALQRDGRWSLSAMDKDNAPPSPPQTPRQEQDPRNNRGASAKRAGWAAATSYRVHPRRYVVIEVFQGRHRIHQWQCGDLLKAIHKEVQVSASSTGILTYRDCRQVFSDISRPIPSIEIRRHCVVVCLPPVMGFVLHNKVYLLFVEELRGDSLIQHLVELSKLHSTAARGSAIYAGAAVLPIPASPPVSVEHKAPDATMSTFAAEEDGDLERRRERGGGRTPDANREAESYPHHHQLHGAGERFSSVLEDGWDLAADSSDTAQPTGGAPSGPLGSSVYPFEYGAIECLISASFDQLNMDIGQVEEQLEAINTKVKKKLSPSALLLEDVHSVKHPIALYDDRVTAFDKVLNELLTNPGDMSRMALSRLKEDDHLFDAPDGSGANKAVVVDADLEIMLEYYDQEMDQFAERVRHMREIVSNTERLMGLRLALMRNKLIYLELAATIIATGVAVGTSLSGIFGMNMHTGFEESREAFAITAGGVALISCASLLIVAYVVYTIRL